MGNCLDSENVSHIEATHLALPRDTKLSERHKAVHRLAGLWSGFGLHVVFHVWAEFNSKRLRLKHCFGASQSKV